MGRPKKNPEDVRSNKIKILFTDEELEVLKSAHARINKKISLNQFMREMLEEGVRKAESGAENTELPEPRRRAVE